MRESWSYKKLGDVATFKRGLTYSGKDEVSFSQNVILRSNNIDLATNTLNLEELKFISSDICIPEDKKLKANSIFMCMSNGSKQHLGKVAFIDHDMSYAFGGFMGLIIPNKDVIYPKYLYFYFCSPQFKDVLKSIGNGVNINNIKFVDIAKNSIFIPSFSEQQLIVSELDKINELISLKKAQFNDLDILALNLFYEMFGDPVENGKGWAVKPLGTIADFKNGINFSKGESGNNYKFLGVSDFQDNNEVCSSSLNDIHLTENLSDDYLLKTGDIVFVRSNGSKELVGRNVLMKVDEPTTFSGFCIRCRLTDKEFNSIYLSCLLKAPSMRPIITNSGRGCNISNLNQKILSALPIIHPSLDLQNLFALYVSAIENQKNQLKKAISDLETLHAARLQYWFN